MTRLEQKSIYSQSDQPAQVDVVFDDSPQWRKEVGEETEEMLRDVQRWKAHFSPTLYRAIEEHHKLAFTSNMPKRIYAHLLNSLIEVTHSEFGYIGEHVTNKETNKQCLQTRAITNTAWDDDSRRLFEEQRISGFTFSNLDSLYGAVVKERQPVISNDPSTDSRAAGTPPGHPEIKHFLGIPLMIGSHIVGSVGLANRPTGYTEDIIDFIRPLLSPCANLMVINSLEHSALVLEKEIQRRMVLEKELVQKTKDMEWLREVTDKIRNTLDVPTILDTAIRELYTHFHPERCSLYFQNCNGVYDMVGRIAEPATEIERLRCSLYLEEGDVFQDSCLHVMTSRNDILSFFQGLKFHDDSLKRITSIPSYCVAMKIHWDCYNNSFASSVPSEGNGLFTLFLHSKEELDAIIRPLHDMGKQMEIGLSQAYMVINSKALVTERETAEALSEAKSNFLATMSHEIRTPMFSIIAHIDLLETSTLSPEQLEMLSYIKTSSSVLVTLVNDILDLSKCENGAIELDKRPFTINSVLESSLDLIYHAANEKHLHLNYAVDPSLPDILFGDDLRLIQVIINLLSNAVKFTRKGEIVINVFATTVSLDELDLCIAVQDTGIGISNEKREVIFNRFSQADSSTTRQYGGSGLGLAICKHLAELMGGSLTVDSKQREGSTFTFLTHVGVVACPAKSASPLPHCAGIDGVRPTALKLPSDYHIVAVAPHASERRSLESKAASCRVQISFVDSIKALFLDPQVKHMLASDDKPQYTCIMVAQEALCGTTGDTHVLLEQLASKSHLVLISFIGFQKSSYMKYFQSIILRPLRLSILKRIFEKVYSGWRGSPSPASNEQKRSGDTLQSRKKVAKVTKKRHILLVEDNPINQRVTQKMIERIGHSCVIQENGSEAFAHLKQQVKDCGSVLYDLILMDLHMPVMDGVECAKAIRAAFEQRPPIVAMTASVSPKDIEDCRSAGMHESHISKPVSLETLRETLRIIFRMS